MIERLRAPQGAWDEDTVKVIEKVNEIVDILNGGNGKKTTPTPRETKERGKANTKVRETTRQPSDKDEVKAKANVTMTMGTPTQKKERDISTRGG